MGRLARKAADVSGGHHLRAHRGGGEDLVSSGHAVAHLPPKHSGHQSKVHATGGGAAAAPFSLMEMGAELGGSCIPLKNRGTHATLEIEVGTPGQKFDVVADTGSNFVIIPSCVCVKSGSCEEDMKCFMGTHKSKTFAMKRKGRKVPMAYIKFGSGDLVASVATDEVKAGLERATMKDSLLLMVSEDFAVSGINGIFGLGPPSGNLTTDELDEAEEEEEEKLEGMRAEESETKGKKKVAGKEQVGKKQASETSHHEAADLTSGSDGAKDTRIHIKGDQKEKTINFSHADQAPARTSSITALDLHARAGTSVKGFLGSAGIHRFSLCFNEEADGVLRFHTPAVHNELKSIGTFHWGLDFTGLSIGGDEGSPKSATRISLCDPDSSDGGGKKKPACGAIPDSGTTMIMAPRDHLVELFGHLCDHWPLCTKKLGEAPPPREDEEPPAHTAAEKQPAKDAKAPAAKEGEGPTPKKAADEEPSDDGKHGRHGAHSFLATKNQSEGFNLLNRSRAKHQVFMELLHDCKSWRKEDEGLEDLPDLNIHVRGGEGSGHQTLKLTGNDYVLETEEEKMNYVTRHLLGVLPVKVAIPSGKKEKVCVPAFGAMEFYTKDHGPVWILGTPIFYAFQVGYNLGSTPPAISFSEGTCGSCSSGAPAALLETSGAESSGVHALNDSAAAASLAQSQAQQQLQRQEAEAASGAGMLRSRVRRPRSISGPPLLPAMDMRSPL